MQNVDNTNQLCLATWPIHSEDPAHYMQKEVLMENVTALSFQLYSPPERLDSKNFIGTKAVDPNKPLFNHWYQNEWPMTYDQMPAIIKINMEIKENQDKIKKWEFNFVLPASDSYIYYPPS